MSPAHLAGRLIDPFTTSNSTEGSDLTTSTAALETLLGGYLHEDWADDYATARSAVDQFAHVELTMHLYPV